MNQPLIDFIKEYMVACGEGVAADITPEEIYWFLDDIKPEYREQFESARWWDGVFNVVKCNGKLIGFGSASTTGDDSPMDKGWEFQLSSICSVRAVEKTIIVYEPVEEVK